MTTLLRHRCSLALASLSLVVWLWPAAAQADEWGRSSSGVERLRAVGILEGTSFSRPSSQWGRYRYEAGDYMVTEDDAELGEVVLMDVIARVSNMDIREVWDIHDIWDLYPEEVATALFLREMTGSSYAAIATLRADDGYAWKQIAAEYGLDPRLLGESPNWYRKDRVEDWWRQDPDIEHRIMIAMLATEYMIEERELDRLSRDGLGYSDMAIMLEFEARSGVNGLRLLDEKMERRVRWRTLADNYRIDIRDLDAKRAYHWHNADFRGYYYGDDRQYHANRFVRTHRTRREYHYYTVWVPNPNTGYYHFDYVVDYDYYFPFGRTYYTYWWPTDCWWDRVCWGYHWSSPIYHRPYTYDVRWVPREPYYSDWRQDPYIGADPPRALDGRRYADRIIERYGDRGAVTGDWDTRVRVSNGGVMTVTRGERGQPGAPRGSSGSPSTRSSNDNRGSGSSSADRGGAAPPPRTSPPPRSDPPPAARGSSSSGGGGGGAAPPRADSGRSSGSGSGKSSGGGSSRRDSAPPPPAARGSSNSGGGGGGAAPPRADSGRSSGSGSGKASGGGSGRRDSAPPPPPPPARSSDSGGGSSAQGSSGGASGSQGSGSGGGGSSRSGGGGSRKSQR